jgi:uncharacterized protein (TIGR03000 family)
MMFLGPRYNRYSLSSQPPANLRIIPRTSKGTETATGIGNALHFFLQAVLTAQITGIILSTEVPQTPGSTSMYSLVLMTALTTAPNGPEFNGYFRDLFRGSSSSASQSNNCGGGIFHGRIITALTFGGGGCSGSCTGSCTGSGCTGRSLSCNGCTGSTPSYSCCGGSVARASCFGSMPGYPVEMGSPYATPIPAYFGSIVPGIPILDPVRVDASYKNMIPAPGATITQRATVTIRLPADARLSVDGLPLELTGAERVFTTPELPLGRDFAYGFKVEYERNGRTLSESQKVTVTAGKTSTVTFDDLTTSATAKPAPTTSATKLSEPMKPTAIEKSALEQFANPFRGNALASNPSPARITIKIPADSTLFVDGKKHEKIGTQREFTTPPIPFGKEFSYELKLVKSRNGQSEELTQKVIFQAGETVTVDFTEPSADRRAAK